MNLGFTPTRMIALRGSLGYWVVTIIFSIFMIVAAMGELFRSPEVVNSLESLDIPLYYLTLLGILKLLGVAAILVPGYPTLKEWAYAGFVFDFVGAIFALVAVRPAFISDYVAAPLALALCVASYILFRKTMKQSQITAPSQ